MINLDEEDIEKLNPNYVLYKATTAHNLAVMSQAMALGADKNWQNPDNLDRTPLHQSISVVRFQLLFINFQLIFNPQTGFTDDLRIFDIKWCQHKLY